VVILSVILLAGFVTSCDWMLTHLVGALTGTAILKIIMSEVTEITSETEAAAIPRVAAAVVRLARPFRQEKKVKESLDRPGPRPRRWAT